PKGNAITSSSHARFVPAAPGRRGVWRRCADRTAARDTVADALAHARGAGVAPGADVPFRGGVGRALRSGLPGLRPFPRRRGRADVDRRSRSADADDAVDARQYGGVSADDFRPDLLVPR